MLPFPFTKMNADLLIVVPAYNEEENILSVMEELRRTVPQYDAVVVNDGSLDGTSRLCREHGIPMIDLATNLGLTCAVQAGARYALQKGYHAMIQIDADLQHDPRYIPGMMSILQQEALDVVIASRFLHEPKNFSLRMIGNRLISLAIRLTTGKRITDPTSGMRIYGERLLPWMAMDLNSSPEPDSVAYLLKQGYRVRECQARMRERIAGESYLNAWNSMKYMGKICWNILVIMWFRGRSRYLCRQHSD